MMQYGRLDVVFRARTGRCGTGHRDVSPAVLVTYPRFSRARCVAATVTIHRSSRWILFELEDDRLSRRAQRGFEWSPRWSTMAERIPLSGTHIEWRNGQGVTSRTPMHVEFI